MSVNLIDFFIKPFLIAVFVSLIGVKISIKIAKKFKILDFPGDRKVHSFPVARLGGLGIYISYQLFLFYFLYSYFDIHEYIIPFMIGGSIIFFLGLLDDIKSLSPKVKFIVQILVALFMIYNNIKITMFIEGEFLTSLITVLWIVGIINSFNLLDNMNGQAAGLGALSSYFLFCLSLSSGNYGIASMSLIFSGVLLGFLYYNFPEAKTFMGDCGSLYIGFNLAIFSIMGTYVVGSKLTHLPVISPVLILAIPIYDTLSVMYIRFKNKKPLFIGDKNHFSHRLTNLGFSKKLAVLFVIFLAAQINLLTLLLKNLTREQALLILFQVIGILIIISLLMYISKRNKIDR